MRKEVLRKLQQTVLYPEIIKEIRTELKEAAENYVINECKKKYGDLMKTGPFAT